MHTAHRKAIAKFKKFLRSKPAFLKRDRKNQDIEMNEVYPRIVELAADVEMWTAARDMAQGDGSRFTEDKCRECGAHIGTGHEAFHIGICDACDELAHPKLVAKFTVTDADGTVLFEGQNKIVTTGFNDVVEVELSKSTPIAAVFVPAEPEMPVGRPLTDAEKQSVSYRCEDMIGNGPDENPELEVAAVGKEEGLVVEAGQQGD